MIINPIIPIWLMAILCVVMLIMKRRCRWAFVRQIIIVILVFAINLRPMLPGKTYKTGRQVRDVNVLFVVDDTISMLALDGRDGEARLEDVKKDCSYIIDSLGDANYSVLSFNNTPIISSPFTSDSGHIKNCIEALYPIEDFYARGSSLNTPKEMMKEILSSAESKYGRKTIVFFISDGEITDDSILGSYSDLKDYVGGGAVLGYGTTEGAAMKIKNTYDDTYEYVQDKSDYPYKNAISKLDEENLKQLSGDLGIDYVHMDSSKSVDSVLEAVKKDSATDKNAVRTVEETIEGSVDIYYFFAFALAAMLLTEVIIAIINKRRH